MKKRIMKRILLAAILTLIIGVLPAHSLYAATAREIDVSVDVALEKFLKEVKGSKEYLDAAKGVLVIPRVVEAGLIAAVFAAGVWAGTTAERFFGGIDPGPVVIDEVLGMLVTLAFIPVGWSAALAGFVLFRLFDVFKPWPARSLERLHGGLGVMADDAMAAVYSNLSLRFLMWLLPVWIA